MRAEFRQIKPNTCNPPLNETRVFPSGQIALVAATGEHKMARLSTGRSQILVDRRPRLIRQLEQHRPAGLLLSGGRPIH